LTHDQVTPHPHARPERSRRIPLIVGLALAAFAIGVTVYLSTLNWVGPRRSTIVLDILRITITGSPLQVAIYVLAGASVLFLLLRRSTRRRLEVGGIAIVGGLVLGDLVLLVIAATNIFGVTLSLASSVWAVAGITGIALAVASFWSTPGWRTIGVAFALVFIILAPTLGINADFGLDPTVGALAGLPTLDTVTIPVLRSLPTPIPTPPDDGALWANWVRPADLPAAGSISQVIIPGTISGFKARPAGLYLPPAALVKNPPDLPLVIMMMGQPGNPDPSFQQAILDGMASRHDGLAPIVLVADQIGNPAVDPLCLNTPRYGNAETYISQDVVDWARTHLHVLQDAAHWTIAGYSNGGECALSLGTKYPSIWQNVLDISGEQYPGWDESAAQLASTFHGNEAAYRATWPTNLLLQGTYPDTVGIFTVGSNDFSYRRQALIVSAAAKAAGWQTTYFEVLNGGHVLGALNGGLAKGYAVLYPRLGLSQPGDSP
jgi:poly(3-hydroxybutyrate) depolymerase